MSRRIRAQARSAAAIAAAAKRLFGFEMQFGPFAVAQLRLLAEMRSLTEMAAQTGAARTQSLHHRHARQSLRRGGAIAADRRGDRQIAARGEQGQARSADHRRHRQSALQGKGQRAGRLDRERRGGKLHAPLDRWSRRPNGASARTRKHLKNLYVYFWRWATLKVFGSGRFAATGLPETDEEGIVCFITVAGFLNGPGFEKMRDDLRRTCSDIWVIDCSPEGHQPDVPTRIFQGVQQPVCIVLAARKLGKG